jgi:hypothetical protein
VVSVTDPYGRNLGFIDRTTGVLSESTPTINDPTVQRNRITITSSAYFLKLFKTTLYLYIIILALT